MSWLKKYYGSDFESLKPELIKEGKFKAIVRLSSKKDAKSLHPSVGYVLVKKNGNHETSPYLVLHEGLASPEDMATMLSVLLQEDEK